MRFFGPSIVFTLYFEIHVIFQGILTSIWDDRVTE